MKIMRLKRDESLTPIQRAVTRRHIILMMESISSANQFVVITAHVVFVRSVLAEIVEMIEARSLQVDLFSFDFREVGFGQNVRALPRYFNRLLL